MQYKIYYLVFILVLHPSLNQGQVNLVQNGSFEITEDCPAFINNNSSIHFAQGWSNACSGNIPFCYSSPDLFNTCDSNDHGIPTNWFGYQESYDGEGYAGFLINAYPMGGSAREFIQNTLIESLIDNCKYKLSFRFSYASFSSYKTDGLNVILSEARISLQSDESVMNGNYFTFNEDSVIVLRFTELLNADTTDWWYFEQEFYSNSPAKYLTIGSIIDSMGTHNEFGWYTSNGTIQGICRGYFDDIRLIQLDSNCVTGLNEVEKKGFVKVYPNPAKSSLNIYISTNQEETLAEIIDIFGRVVFSKQLGKDELNALDVSTISTGWYLVRITRPLSGSFVQSVFIER